VWEDDGDDSMREISGLSRKQKRGAVFLGVITICLIFIIYSFLIPRAELSVNTTVHYSFSGISIGVQVRNTGTLEITDLSMNITVTNEDGEKEYQEEFVIGVLGKRERVAPSFNFKAPQIDPYTLTLRFDFSCDGQEYNETIQHEMKDYMNFIWKDRIRDWRL